MHKKDWMNDLIPADDLYWCEEEKKYVVVSKEEEDKLFRACFGCGLEEKETLRILKSFTYYKTSEVLFKHFLEGNIGIYSFDETGSPIFEKIKEEDQFLDLVCFREKLNEIEDRFVDFIEVDGGQVGSSQTRDLVPFDRMYKTITKWCEDKGFDLWKKENPDNEDTWLKDREEDVSKKLRDKGWSLEQVEVDGERLYLRVRLGRWFEFYGEDNKDGEEELY